MGAACAAEATGAFLETAPFAAFPFALPVASLKEASSSSSFFSPSFLGVAICVMSLA